MSEIIAIFFISFNNKIEAKYYSENCYRTETDYRPNLIKIISRKNDYYEYKIWYNHYKKWSEVKLGKINTIQSIYNQKSNCT